MLASQGPIMDALAGSRVGCVGLGRSLAGKTG